MTIQGPEGPEPTIPLEEPAEPAQASRNRFDPWTLVLGILGGALLGTGVTFAILGSTGVFAEPTTTTNPPPPSVTTPPPTSTPPRSAVRASATDIAQHAIPSIVAVEVSGLLGESGGSGVVYGSDGYLITNDHVVEGAEEVTVVFADGARYPGQIIGTDPLTDVAVLRVTRDDLTPMDIGDPAALTVGDMAVAIGNPLALMGGPSVTSGIISALDRWLEVKAGTFLYGLVQTDAPITHGSSGRALVDENARVVGIDHCHRGIGHGGRRLRLRDPDRHGNPGGRRPHRIGHGEPRPPRGQWRHLLRRGVRSRVPGRGARP